MTPNDQVQDMLDRARCVGVTQKEISEASGITTMTLWRIATGRANPLYKTVQDVMEAGERLIQGRTAGSGSVIDGE